MCYLAGNAAIGRDQKAGRLNPSPAVRLPPAVRLLSTPCNMPVVNVKVIPKQALGGPLQPFPPVTDKPAVVVITVGGKRVEVTDLGVKAAIASAGTAYVFPEAFAAVVGFALQKLIVPVTIAEAAITLAINVGLAESTGHSPADYVLAALSPLVRITDIPGIPDNLLSNATVTQEDDTALVQVMILYDPAS